MFITLNEIIDIVIMTFAIGYIFSNFIKREPAEGYDPLDYYKRNQFLENLKFGIIAAAPAVVLHELAHKFVAMGFGASATVAAPSLFGYPYDIYLIVILMTLIRFPIIFFVGGVTYISGNLSLIGSAISSFAGPLINLLMYALFISLVKFKLVDRKNYRTLLISAKLNLFLFGFNMIPIPGFDGYNVLMSLLKVFGF